MQAFQKIFEKNYNEIRLGYGKLNSFVLFQCTQIEIDFNSPVFEVVSFKNVQISTIFILGRSGLIGGTHLRIDNVI